MPCTTTLLLDIEKKLDKVIEMLQGNNGFGKDILANVIGNLITR